MISTRDLSGLPGPEELCRLLQSLAMLDAILCRDWESRFYSFNASWADGAKLGSMRNGQGDDFFALFNANGCFLKGFAHEAPMSPYRDDRSKQLWPGMIEAVPAEFAECLREPAFGVEDTTFCIWRRHSDSSWQRGQIEFPPGPDPDGSEYLLALLDGNPETYRAWALGHYNKPFLTVDMVQPIYDHRPLTNDLIAALTPDVILDDPGNPRLGVTELDEEILEIGYPRAN